MKRTLLFSALAVSALSIYAQAIEQPSLCQNWSIGVDAGVATPLIDYPFFSSMRGVVGLNVAKQITPTFGLGAEGQFTINTSSWTGYKSRTAFDASYVGVYGKVNLMNLFQGYQCEVRPFTIDAVAGIGWGHEYLTKHQGDDHNFAATKVGLNLNYNISPSLTLSLQPAIMWDMSDAGVSQTSFAYNAKKAAFTLLAGVNYKIGGEQFNCVVPLDPATIDALNAQINSLRGQLADAEADAQTWKNRAANLNNQLQNTPQVVETTVTEVNNYLNTVRYVFFKLGSSVITNDQMPNVEMIAAYMKNHPSSKVVVKGYASKDGPEEVNIRLAQSRAESVKNALVKKYGIAASRIQAEGEGIGNMFDEESWNRVSICTIENEQ